VSTVLHAKIVCIVAIQLRRKALISFGRDQSLAEDIVLTSDGTIRRFIGRVWRCLHHSRPAHRGVDRMKVLNRHTGYSYQSVNAGDRSREWPWWGSAIGAGVLRRVSLALLACALSASTSIAAAAGADSVLIDLAPHLMRVQLEGKVEPHAPKDAGTEAYLATVPLVKGESLEQAVARLREAHLSYQLTGEAAGQKYEDRIADQHPQAGSRVDANSKVQLTRQLASTREGPTTVAVPWIKNMSVPAARATLQASGLELAPFDSVAHNENNEIVERQDPSPPVRVPLKSQVSVVVRAPTTKTPPPPPPTTTTSTPPETQPQIQPETQPQQAPPSSVNTRGSDGGSEAKGPETCQHPPCGSFWRDHPWMTSIGAALCVAVGIFVAGVRNRSGGNGSGGKGSGRVWPVPFIVHATLTCGPGAHAFRAGQPRIACPPVTVRLTLPQQPVIRVTFSPDSTH
jgi:hypothetical protein